jgi:hypothetical protein
MKCVNNHQTILETECRDCCRELFCSFIRVVPKRKKSEVLTKQRVFQPYLDNDLSDEADFVERACT